MNDNLESVQLLKDMFDSAVADLNAPPIDPMDTPLPCDVQVGHVTMRKGVPLRTLVSRMKVLYEMATGENADKIAGRSLEERMQAVNTLLIEVPAPTADEIAEMERFEYWEGDGLYAEMEREQLGDPDLKTGIYAEKEKPQ